jgi:hypothetical protein
MAVFQLILFVLLGLSISSMLSGFMLARRMGFYLMPQVMSLMLAMLVSIVALVFGLFFLPASPAMFDIMHIILVVDLVLFLVATLMQFIQVFPVLLKTMQGGPFHSSHMTNLLVTLFYLLGIVMYYVDLAAL